MLNLRNITVSCCALLALAAGALAMTIPKGTAVMLAFDDALNSKTAHVGDRVRLHVIEDVVVGGKTVIRRGAPVTATISEVKGKGRFGKNAQLKLDITPVRYMGTSIPLQPRQKGNMIGGSRGTQAAGVAGAGAVVLGPLGLAAGYFVVGKAVNVKPGTKLETQVAEDVTVR
jgi:hypothetical protein